MWVVVVYNIYTLPYQMKNKSAPQLEAKIKCKMVWYKMIGINTLGGEFYILGLLFTANESEAVLDGKSIYIFI